jgi:hypothetical protein
MTTNTVTTTTTDISLAKLIPCPAVALLGMGSGATNVVKEALGRSCGRLPIYRR